MKNGKMKGLLMALVALTSLQMGTLYAAESGDVPASLDADTLEYNMNTGEAVASGNVLLKRGTSKVCLLYTSDAADEL